jgi:hypothetical protein
VPSGPAYARAEVRHAGRTVATVQVEMFDARRKLAVIALVTMVTPDALAADLHNTAADPFQRQVDTVALEPGFMAPVQHSLKMLTEEEMLAAKDGALLGSYAANVRHCFDGTPSPIGQITVPWNDLRWTGPEAACLGADAVIAAPLLDSSIPNEVLGPNPDLTLEVQAGDNQLAHGLATSLLLPPT